MDLWINHYTYAMKNSMLHLSYYRIFKKPMNKEYLEGYKHMTDTSVRKIITKANAEVVKDQLIEEDGL